MGSSKQANLWKNVILPLIGTGGLGAIIIALLSHTGGHNVTAGNVSGNVAIGDHATIQINTNPLISNQPNPKLNFEILTPNQIIAEIRVSRPAAREAVEKSFEGASVDWTLKLLDISRYESSTNLFVITLLDGSDYSDSAMVAVVAKKSQLADLNLLDSGATVHVHGLIDEANELKIWIKDATLTPGQ